MKVISTKELITKRGEHTKGLQRMNPFKANSGIGDSYLVVSNSQNVNKSLIIMNIDAFAELLLKAGFLEESGNVLETKIAILSRMKKRQSELGSRPKKSND